MATYKSTFRFLVIQVISSAFAANDGVGVKPLLGELEVEGRHLPSHSYSPRLPIIQLTTLIPLFM